MAPTRIIGSPVSPFVRKVLIACALKGVAVELDPIVPFFGSDDFTAISPLRKIPVLIDDEVTLSDSSAIGEYLNERYPTPPLLPAGAGARGRARWVEEVADTVLADVLLFGIFTTAVVRPGVWKEPRDEARIAGLLTERLPPVMAVLEGLAPSEGFLFGALTTSDIAVAVHFANLGWSRTGADLSAWPRTAAWTTRVEAVPDVARLTQFAERFLTTRIDARPALFETFGMTLAASTVGGRTPRPGLMG